jgi:hypothetical protein
VRALSPSGNFCVAAFLRTFFERGRSPGGSTLMRDQGGRRFRESLAKLQSESSGCSAPTLTCDRTQRARAKAPLERELRNSRRTSCTTARATTRCSAGARHRSRRRNRRTSISSCRPAASMITVRCRGRRLFASSSPPRTLPNRSARRPSRSSRTSPRQTGQRHAGGFVAYRDLLVPLRGMRSPA